MTIETSGDIAPRGVRKYLLRSEQKVIAVRRHWQVLMMPFIQALAALFAAGFLLSLVPTDNAYVDDVIVAVAGFFVLRWLWKLGEWWVEQFVITDQRVLLVSGLLTRKVAVMPLTKVTDLTFQRSILGRMLGYGEFIVESAGQVQALSRISYLPHPEQLYHDVSALLFARGDQDGGD
jgi:uncharacterized membrane protein YdbT with pleckstrin-like domain